MAEQEDDIPKTPSQLGVSTDPEDLGYETTAPREDLEALGDETVFVIDQEEFEKEYEVE